VFATDGRDGHVDGDLRCVVTRTTAGELGLDVVAKPAGPTTRMTRAPM